MSLRHKPILIIGGTGFIGSRLAETLITEHGAWVSVISRDFRKAPYIARYPVRLLQGDVENATALLNAMAGHEIVVDCSFPSHGDAKCRRAAGARIGRNLTEAALIAGTARLVHLSSVMAYGTPKDGPLDETAACRPSGDPYGDGKLAVEQALLEAHKARALPVVVLQPTIVYGPNAGWTIHPIQQLRAAPLVLPNNGQGLCNAVYVDDVVGAIVLAMTRPDVEGQRFLISAAEPVTWHAFYRALIDGLGAGELALMDTRGFLDERKRQVRDAAPGLRRLVREMRTNAVLRQSLMVLPVLAQVAAAARLLLPKDKLARIKGRVLQQSNGPAGSARPTDDAARRNAVLFPPAHHTELYAARCRVRIDKARQILGYAPRFDLERGMQLTAAWAKWAGIAPPDDPGARVE